VRPGGGGGGLAEKACTALYRPDGSTTVSGMYSNGQKLGEFDRLGGIRVLGWWVCVVLVLP